MTEIKQTKGSIFSNFIELKINLTTVKLIELNKTYIIRTQVEQNAVNPKENESHGNKWYLKGY